MLLTSWLGKTGTFLPQRIPGPMAVLYEKIAAPGLRGFYRQVAIEVTSLLSSGKVLDVGTGPGYLLVEIAKHNPNLELVGLDMSKKMLKIAEKLIEQNNGASASIIMTERAATAVNTSGSSRLIQLVRGDVRNLPFPDGAFDLVVSTLSLHHWHDPARGIRECWRVTAPGGRCWIYDLRSDVPASVHAKLLVGEGLSHSLLSWIFKFHGVNPKEFESSTVFSWLSSDATVQAEVHAAYLKLNIEKPLCESPDKTICRTATADCWQSLIIKRFQISLWLPVFCTMLQRLDVKGK